MKKNNHNRKREASNFLFIYFEPQQDFYRIWTDHICKKPNVIVVPYTSLEMHSWQRHLVDMLHSYTVEILISNLIIRRRVKKALRAALKNADKRLKKCFCFSMHYEYVRAGLVKYVKKAYRGSKTFYDFGDKISMYYNWYPEFDLVKFCKNFDIVATYNQVEAEEYGLLWSPPRGVDLSDIEPADCKNFDVFFAGKTKDRTEKIIAAAEKCLKLGLSIRFYIIGALEIPNNLPEGVICQKNNIPYRKFLGYTKKANAILNIFQGGSDSIDLREQEAVLMNKILITDGKVIFSSPFYTESKVIPLNDLENQVDKIKNKDDSVKWNNEDTMSDCNKYFNWIESNLEKSR